MTKTTGAFKCRLDFTLEVEGPFLCKATAPAMWGIDASFDRNYEGKFYIDRSHIKGKVREALIETGIATKDEILSWLGGEGENKDGRIYFSDFFLEGQEQASRVPEGTLSRIRVEPERKVVENTALVAMENAFPSGSVTKWNGNIHFLAKDDKDFDCIAPKITAALKWIDAFGSEKAIGFGQLRKVVSQMKKKDPVTLPGETGKTEQNENLSLYIKASEPFLLPHERKKQNNYMESDIIITGNRIKGALVQAINEYLNPGGTKTPVGPYHKSASTHLPFLAKYFEKIRFTHAFPSAVEKRPVVIPYSCIQTDDKYVDVSLCDNPEETLTKDISFQIDWKDPSSILNMFGWVNPITITKTRTAIDGKTRSAKKEKLFTYQYVCPVYYDDTEKREKQVIWVGNVNLGAIDNIKERAQLVNELRHVCSNWLRHLGKRDSSVNVDLRDGSAEPVQAEAADRDNNGLYVVTLQADTMMVDHKDLINKGQTGEGLNELYKNYWEEISTNGKDGPVFRLERFYAHQVLRTTYESSRSKNGKFYYPFFLTGAGSVFVLSAVDGKENDAVNLINKWRQRGLPVPKWVKDTYNGGKGEGLWRSCPFVPENGYGEIAVYLQWQKDNYIMAQGGNEE